MLRLLARIDRTFAGRRLVAAATIVFTCAILGPALDAWQHNVAPVWTVVLANTMLLLLWVLALAWLGAMRDDAGESTGAFAWRRLRMLGASLFRGYEELRGAAARVRWQSAGRHLVLFGCLLLIFRGSSVLAAVALGAEVLPESGAVLLGVGCACFVLGVALLQWAAWGTRNATATELAHARSSIGALTAIVDLNRDVGRQFSGPDPVSLTLSALAQWRLRTIRKYPDVHAYKEALERHLRLHVHAFKCRREIWLGRTRDDGIADLLIGGVVWVGIARGFSADLAEQVLAEVRRYPKTWADKPKLLVIFDASHRDVFDNAAVAALQQLHEQASLVAVRM